MAAKNMKILLSAIIVFLLIFVLVLRLALDRSNAFFIVAGVDFTAMLAVFVWTGVQHALDPESIMGALGAKIVAAASVILFVVLVVVLWVRVLGLHNTFFLVAAADGVVILSLLLWATVPRAMAHLRRSFHRNRVDSEGEEAPVEYGFLRRFAGLPTEFRYEELAAATDNFRAPVGRGASSTVFKGVLDGGTPVAVKRIELGGEGRGDRDFRSEVVAIAGVHHVNLVRLLGYCLVPEGRRFLVYEFFENGSLDAWIFSRTGEDDTGNCLPWALRCRVAMDVAKALAYLHHDCRSRVLHLDVKPENILLDEEFRACVSDFGMSRLVGREESTVFTTIRGTRGYFAPEWFKETGISDKSDVYSFGMVLLELVGGRRNVSPQHSEIGGGDNPDGRCSYFPKIVSEKVRQGKLMEVVDLRLLGGDESIEEGEVRVLVHVALWCIQDRRELRPSMVQVVHMLQGLVAVETPPVTPLYMADMLSVDGVSAGASSSGDQAATARWVEHQMGSRRPTMSNSSSSFSVSTI